MDSSSANSVSSVSSSISATPTSKSKISDSPLWNYVTVLDKLEGTRGGNVRWKCNFCKKDFTGSVSRVHKHVLKVPNGGIQVCCEIDETTRKKVQKEVDEEAAKKGKTQPHPFAHPVSKSCSYASSLGGTAGTGQFRVEGVNSFDQRKRKASGKGPLEKLVNNEVRDQLHSEIARMFYSGGLPFHLARNPYFVSSYTMAANQNIVGYLPPGYNLLRTTLLAKEREAVERHLIPIKMKWKENGLSLVSDGWTDSQKRPIINIMATTDGGAMFLKAVNCEGEYKDKEFIANILKEQIKEVGHRNVVQVITDNAPVCKAAGLLVENEFPHIYWTPCVVHTLNLALKAMCSPTVSSDAFVQCGWIGDISTAALAMKHFITNHSLSNAIYNEVSNLKMLSIAPTRFASVVVMLRRMLELKRSLTLVVISEKWDDFKDEDRVKAAGFKKKVMDDEWWDNIKYIVDFTDPIYEMVRLTDTDKPCLHLIYDMWDTMIAKVKAVIYKHEGKNDSEESEFYKVIHRLLVFRWNKSNTPLHCLAHSLNPRYYTTEWLEGGIGRLAPHQDVEISNERNKCFRRYFPNSDERRQVMVEFANFSSLRHDFSDVDSIIDRTKLEPSYWWLIYGNAAPMLKSIAVRLLGQPASSSCCERNWSTYSFIHSMRRNKMTPKRAEDLVFVHTNLRLLSRSTQSYAQGQTKMWDVGGDTFETPDGAGLLEVANISLDEPEFEKIVFVDEGDEDDEVLEFV
ncbi:hAT transposon superfamily [Euphorbia peplus]|nr:hAT transposon superfamily [Euphorbia peplus]